MADPRQSVMVDNKKRAAPGGNYYASPDNPPPINPFQAPTTEKAASEESSESLSKLARAQKLLIYAMLINIGALALRGLPPMLVGSLGLLAFFISVFGVIGMGPALRFSTPVKVILAMIMFVSVANLIALLVLNSKATKALRAGGYKVGLLGASKR
jgi:hypothetical protein